MTELNILHSNGKKVSIDQITYRLPFRFQSVIEYDNIYIFHCYPNILDSNEEHQNFEKENRNSVFAFSKNRDIIWFFSNGSKILKEKSRENLLIIYDDNFRYLVDVSSSVIINKVPHF